MQQLQAQPDYQPLMKVAGHLPMDAARQERFLQAVAISGNLGRAAQICDGSFTARTWKRLIDNDPEFRVRYHDSLDAYSSTIANIIHSEVVDGVDTPIVSNGEILAWVKRRDSKLLSMVARAHFKQYRDFKTVSHEGKITVGGDDSDPAATILSSDLWQLSSQDTAELLRILKIIHDNRGSEMALSQRTVDGELVDVTPRDPWEDEPDMIPARLSQEVVL